MGESFIENKKKFHFCRCKVRFSSCNCQNVVRHQYDGVSHSIIFCSGHRPSNHLVEIKATIFVPPVIGQTTQQKEIPIDNGPSRWSFYCLVRFFLFTYFSQLFKLSFQT